MTTVLFSQLAPQDITFGGSSDIKRCRVVHVKPGLRVQTPVVTFTSDVEIPRVGETATTADQPDQSDVMKRKRRMAFTCDDRTFLEWLDAVDAHAVKYLQDNKDEIFATPLDDAVISHALRSTVTDGDNGTFVVGISESMRVFDKSRKQVAESHLQPGTRARLILALNQIAWGKTILTIKYIVKDVKLEDVDVNDPEYSFVDDDFAVLAGLDPEVTVEDTPAPEVTTTEPEFDDEEVDAMFCE